MLVCRRWRGGCLGVRVLGEVVQPGLTPRHLLLLAPSTFLQLCGEENDGKICKQKMVDAGEGGGVSTNLALEPFETTDEGAHLLARIIGRELVLCGELLHGCRYVGQLLLHVVGVATEQFAQARPHHLQQRLLHLHLGLLFDYLLFILF